jgi:hypothetical protein
MTFALLSWRACAPLLLLAVLPASPQSTEGRFLRLHWFEHGLEHGNPVSNRRFRVNAPEAVLHPSFGKRSETRSSGMLQIFTEEDLSLIDGAELYLELWGGHPGTANKRVTLNGRSTYPLPEVGVAQRHCTHEYPVVPLKITDLVNGYNALQFACDQGSSFWGHFIVDNACLRAVLKKDHPDLAKAGLTGFQASVRAVSGGADQITVSLAASQPEAVAAVDFQGFYTGYDENADTQSSGWHGFTKERRPVAFLGTATQAPFQVTWDTSMLPAQKGVLVRAWVHLRGPRNLVYATAPSEALEIPSRAGRDVRLYLSRDLPPAFISRIKRRPGCTIELDVEPSRIERAELHVVTWDGGRGTIKDYFTLNGVAFPVAEEGKHDVIYSRLPVDPKILRRGPNRIELYSDTEHHGIEILLPGPALMIRARQ